MDYFGPVRPPALGWSLPAANFSHVLSIYGGHYFDLMFHLVGAPSTVNGILASQFPKLTLSQTGESFPNEKSRCRTRTGAPNQRRSLLRTDRGRETEQFRPAD